MLPVGLMKVLGHHSPNRNGPSCSCYVARGTLVTSVCLLIREGVLVPIRCLRDVTTTLIYSSNLDFLFVESCYRYPRVLVEEDVLDRLRVIFINCRTPPLDDHHGVHIRVARIRHDAVIEVELEPFERLEASTVSVVHVDRLPGVIPNPSCVAKPAEWQLPRGQDLIDTLLLEEAGRVNHYVVD